MKKCVQGFDDNTQKLQSLLLLSPFGKASPSSLLPTTQKLVLARSVVHNKMVVQDFRISRGREIVMYSALVLFFVKQTSRLFLASIL